MTVPFENDTGNIVRKLARKSLKSEKRRNLMVVIAVALASCLICFSIVMALSTRQIEKNHVEDTYEAVYTRITEEDVSTLKGLDDFSRVGEYYMLAVEPAEQGYNASYAVKYRTKQPVLRISTHKQQDQVVLVVEDNGIGIAASDLPRIFEKGFTGQNGRLIQQSTGIGLYLCKRLCEKLGIGITAESSEHGTAISLSFHINCLIHEVQS